MGHIGENEVHVRIVEKPGSLLVLVRTEGLKEFADSAKTELLDSLNLLLDGVPGFKGKSRYLGLYGKMFLGAAQNPAGRDVGTVVPSEMLYRLFGPRRSKRDQ